MAKLNITQVRSRIGSTKLQKKNLDALGLRKMNRTVTHEDSPVIRGMIEKVHHLVVVTQANEDAKAKASSAVETPADAVIQEPKADKPAPEKSAEPKKPVAKADDKKPAAKKPAAKTPAAEKDVKPATTKKDE